jgi:hypothetical protein
VPQLALGGGVAGPWLARSFHPVLAAVTAALEDAAVTAALQAEYASLEAGVVNPTTAVDGAGVPSSSLLQRQHECLHDPRRGAWRQLAVLVRRQTYINRQTDRQKAPTAPPRLAASPHPPALTRTQHRHTERALFDVVVRTVGVTPQRRPRVRGAG